MRIIPKKTKISIELFKGVSLTDILVGLLFVSLAVLAATSSFAGRLYVAAALAVLGVMLLSHIGDEPNYMYFLSILRYLVGRKTFSKQQDGSKNIANINAFQDIQDGFIVYKDYYGAAIEIPPVEFRFFSAYRRTVSIDECLGNVLRSLNGNYAANLVKIERRVPYDEYLFNEQKKLQELRRCFECALISEEEFQAKCEVVFDRVSELERMNAEDRTVAAYYYLVFFDSDKNQLRMQVDSAVNVLQRGEMQPKKLNSKELALFLKYSNELDFDEKQLDTLSEREYARWAMPEELRLKSRDYRINGMTAYTMAISNYPLWVGDAWLAGVMSIPATKVVVKLQPMDKQKTVRNIDRSISELRGRYSHTNVDSTLIEINNHIQSLSKLLSMLQSDNEVLINTDVYVTCYDLPLTRKEGSKAAEGSHRANINNMRSMVRRLYREADLRLSGLPFDQMNGYIGSQVSGYDPFAKTWGRGLPGATAAAIYPWIFAHVQDPLGIKLGAEDGVPVFIDMFRRDSERVNSNVVIVGKSGSGKSYAAKSILVNLAADNSKIFVLDPENEYSELAENLHGKFINVGNAQQGRINPFQIITALQDDDADGGVTGSYASHMQFLEEFYRQILPDCEKEALEYLNTLTDRVYMNKGITAETNLGLLSPQDYPTFSDIFDEILVSFQSTDNDYLRGILRTLMNYVSKFASGGRNANIWDGASTVTTDENFTVFNFQSLLAGGNKTVTNAQMMLVMKHIDNEIIKNREYNTRYGTNRKIVVVIDEAHVFIDEKYPIALDFMYQLAKRIRKYNGMQIVITQNIKDFVGSEEISRKSSAIINACQYSYIFSLAPNDMGDLCKLYEKAGGINEAEQEKIVTAPRGNAFVVLGPTSRSSFQVEVPRDVVQVFEQKNVCTRYFAGQDGMAQWQEFLGDSSQKYLENRRFKPELFITRQVVGAETVTLKRLTGAEYDRLAAERLQAEQTVQVSQPAAEPQAAPDDTVLPPVVQQSIVTENREMAQMVTELHRMVDSVQALSSIMAKMQLSGAANSAMQAIAVQTAAVQAAAQQAIGIPAQEQEQQPPKSETPREDGYSVDDFFADFEDDQPDEEARPSGKETETAEESDKIGSENLFEDFYSFLQDDDGEDDARPELGLKERLAGLATIEEDTSDLDEEENDLQELLSATTSAAAIPAAKETDNSVDLFGETEKIDIMSLIEQSKEEIDRLTVLDDMNYNREKVRKIGLSELIRLNQSRKRGMSL